MDKGIYTALSGGMAKAQELDLIANNLANVSTPGFKRDTGTFNEYLQELRRPDTAEALGVEIAALTLLDGRPPGDKSFVEMDGVYTDYRQGSLRRTGRTLDFGVEGEGFFEILTPSGLRYTRQGNFTVSENGELVTVNGFPVLAPGDGDPQGRTIQVQTGAPVQGGEDGVLYQNGVEIGRLKLQEFYDRQWLEKVGSSYFRNMSESNLKEQSENSKVHQEHLEGSNVNPVREMTKLISATRSYEAHMQAVKTYKDIDEKTVNQIAKEL